MNERKEEEEEDNNENEEEEDRELSKEILCRESRNLKMMVKRSENE